MDDFKGEPQTVFQAPAKLIGPVIHERREKTRQQEAVTGLDFNHVEARLYGALGRANEVPLDLLHLRRRHLLRHLTVWFVALCGCCK